ncbi:MAG: hypothetical protein ACYC56_09390 [Candidatus Aquicultor sp.]
MNNDAQGRRLFCPQHGFRLGKLLDEKTTDGILTSFVLKCPKCSYKERRILRSSPSTTNTAN